MEAMMEGNLGALVELTLMVELVLEHSMFKTKL